MIGNTQDYIKRRVHELYYGIDMNCARTTLTVLSELLNVKLEGQTMDAALGLYGAGGFQKSDPPHLCEKMSSNALRFAYKYVTDWIPEEKEPMPEAQKRVKKQFSNAFLDYRKHLLKFANITAKNDFRIYEYKGIYYLYEYVPYRKLDQADKRK